MKEDEVVLVDENGFDCLNPDGTVKSAGKSEAHAQGLRHRAVSVFIFNKSGQVLLQKRALDKYHSGGLWSNTCCTHPSPGEAPADVARRRLQEEMGMECALKEVFQFAYFAEVGTGVYESEYDHVFIGFSEVNPLPDPEEVSDWRWTSIEEVKQELASDPEKYSYWFRFCFSRVFEQNFGSPGE